MSTKTVAVTVCSYDIADDSQFFTESIPTETEDYLGFYVDSVSTTATQTLTKKLTLQKTVENTSKCALSWDLTV